MAPLRNALGSAGYASVRSYIQSGNLILQSDDSREAVERGVADIVLHEFGFRPTVAAMPQAALEQAVTGNPFPDIKDPKTLHLWFFVREPAPGCSARLEVLAAPGETWERHGFVLYLHAPDGIARSKFAAGAERQLGVPATSRNWRTVLKLCELCQLG